MICYGKVRYGRTYVNFGGTHRFAHRQQKIIFPTSEGVSEVSAAEGASEASSPEQANE